MLKDRGKQRKVRRQGNTFTLVLARALEVLTSARRRGALFPAPVPALLAFPAPWTPACHLIWHLSPSVLWLLHTTYSDLCP